MYVDILYDRDWNKIKVVERVNCQRVYRDFTPDYHFFINDPRGTHTTMYGNPVKKIIPKNSLDLRNYRKMYEKSPGTIWESDVKPHYRCLEQNYKGAEFPKLQVAFFDIETAFHPIDGYCTAEEATNEILSITVYLQWLDQTVCIAVPPPNITFEEATIMADEVGDVILVHTEYDLLEMFLTLIVDADVLSGWNSELYDIPFVVNRILKVMGKLHAKRMCLWGKLPESATVEFGGKEEAIYRLVGRIHFDLMKLYKKFNTEEKSSYSLANIAIAEEIDEGKMEYDGSLDHLYHYEFKQFLEYNKQDTKLLNAIDTKLQYIGLANSMAHVGCIPLPAVMGAVGMTEQAIVMEAHSLGLVVPDKKPIEEDDKTGHRAAGGWVSHPKIGIHKWIAATDMNSLYPSVIRACNMSNETIIGQIRTHETNAAIAAWEAIGGAKHTFAEWWNDRFSTLEMEHFFNRNDSHILYLDFNDGTTLEITGAQLYSLIFDSGKPWCISANGTIFDTTKIGVIPSLLGRWYNERKIMKKCMNMYESLLINEKSEGIVITDSVLFSNTDIDYDKYPAANCYAIAECFNVATLSNLIRQANREEVVKYMNTHRLHLIDGKVHYYDQNYLPIIVDYWSNIQHVRKILLNSLYGGLLNRAHRFFDQRIGQSTTLTGRNVNKHMSAKTNEIFTGEYDHVGVTTIYQDTDSVYFSAYPVLKDAIASGDVDWSVENIITLYDTVSAEVNATFPDFMLNTFNVPHSYGKVIASSRETVAKTGLFIKKKRYAVLVVDKEGIRQDVGGKAGKVKVTGLDLRRNDTIKPIQKFLKEVLRLILEGHHEAEVVEYICNFKKEFKQTPVYTWGKPSKSNNLTAYSNKRDQEYANKLDGYVGTKGFTIPGQVVGAMNWNELRESNNDNESMKIMDGMKISFCYLLLTPENSYDRISYPVDELRLPTWFYELPFDSEKMLTAALDKKVHNMIGILGWNLSKMKADNDNFDAMYVYDDDDC